MKTCPGGTRATCFEALTATTRRSPRMIAPSSLIRQTHGRGMQEASDSRHSSGTTKPSPLTTAPSSWCQMKAPPGEQGRRASKPQPSRRGARCAMIVLSSLIQRASSWNARGVGLAGLKRYDEALAAYDRAIELAPNEGFPWRNKAYALTALGRARSGPARRWSRSTIVSLTISGRVLLHEVACARNGDEREVLLDPLPRAVQRPGQQRLVLQPVEHQHRDLHLRECVRRGGGASGLG